MQWKTNVYIVGLLDSQKIFCLFLVEMKNIYKKFMAK